MLTQDRMLVCRAGHLITDRLTTRPDLRLPRCDRCGADTLDRCDTCGTLLAGALQVHGLDPVGSRPPRVCTTCGGPFPWTKLDDPPPDEAIENLEHLLRRLPWVVRELRPAPDLDTLIRALLHIHFDDIRPEVRTPRYSSGNGTAFVLPEIDAVLVAHRAVPGVGEAELTHRRAEDVESYRGRCRTLVFFVFDPEHRLPERLEAVWSDDRVRCVVAH